VFLYARAEYTTAKALQSSQTVLAGRSIDVDRPAKFTTSIVSLPWGEGWKRKQRQVWAACGDFERDAGFVLALVSECVVGVDARRPASCIKQPSETALTICRESTGSKLDWRSAWSGHPVRDGLARRKIRAIKMEFCSRGSRCRIGRYSGYRRVILEHQWQIDLWYFCTVDIELECISLCWQMHAVDNQVVGTGPHDVAAARRLGRGLSDEEGFGIPGIIPHVALIAGVVQNKIAHVVVVRQGLAAAIVQRKAKEARIRHLDAVDALRSIVGVIVYPGQRNLLTSTHGFPVHTRLSW